MAYTNTWNAAFEALPADSDSISAGADRIRDLKNAIRERMEKDHYFDETGTDADHGEHIKVTLRVGAAPTKAADKGMLYAKDMLTKAELFYRDEDGDEVQITDGGALAVGTLDGDHLDVDMTPSNYTPTTTGVAEAADVDDLAAHLKGIDNALASVCRIATGTYTGDGSTSQGVTGVGFAPKYLKIWKLGADGAGAVIFEKSDTSGWGTLAVKHANIALVISNADNAIISLDADGFTVDDAGSDQNPNANGETYHFLALG